jgi:hypothetical protein
VWCKQQVGATEGGWDGHTCIHVHLPLNHQTCITYTPPHPPPQKTLNQGCIALELLYYSPVASPELLSLECRWKMEWVDYLDCMVGERRAWSFPYQQRLLRGELMAMW